MCESALRHLSYAQFVISVLVLFVCVCVRAHAHMSLSQSKDMVKWKFRAMLSYSWVAGVLISAVLIELLSLPPLGRSWDSTSLLSSGIWYCLEDEVIAKVENVWNYTFMTWGWVILEAKFKHRAVECMCQVEWKPAGTLSICTTRYMPCQKLDQNLTICKICGRQQGNT